MGNNEVSPVIVPAGSLENFQAMVQGRRIPGRLTRLRQQSSNSRENMAVRIHRTIHQRRESCSETEPRYLYRILLSIQFDEGMHMRILSKDEERIRGNHQKGLEITIPD